MQIVVLIAIATVLSLGPPQELFFPCAGWAVLAGGTVGYVLGAAALAWVLSRWGLRRLSGHGASYTAVVSIHYRWQILAKVWLAGGLGALMAFGLGHRLAELRVVAAVPLVGSALVLAVFLVALILYWRIAYRFDRAVRWQVEQDLLLAGQPVRCGWSARQYLDFNIRHHVLFVAIPIGVIVLINDLGGLLARRLLPANAATWAAAAILPAAIGGVFFLSPLLLILVWRTRPMPDGQMRRRLERLCERIGLRYRQLRIWDTGGVIANAGVMGLHRSVRYILISDALIENMPDRQIVAVFGHEAGHAKHHHVTYFLVYIAGAVLLCTSVVGSAVSLAGISAIQELVITAGAMVLIWGVGFGWLSRRLERQADVFGAWCATIDAEADGETVNQESDLGSGASSFRAALENVARLNGMPRRARNWRHGSVVARVAFLADWVDAGYSRKAFDRTMGRIKLALWLILLAGAVGASATYRLWR
ncbi:MAG: M48 family metalloprotease [Planctomycetes bacterium]|nr:M48 family metalloprotease [Planctomycetota bacterium]